MNRFLLPLLAVLTLGYVGLAPQKAEAATCSAVANNGYYPQGFLTWCAASTSTQQDAITGLYTLSTNFADAKAKLTATPKTHEFFVFDTVADLASVCTTNGNTTSNPPVPACPNQGTVPTTVYGVTWRTGSAGSYVYWSAAFLTNIASTATTWHTHVGNTLVHEAGHQLDAVYGPLYNAGAASSEFTDVQARITGDEIVIGGTPVAGDIVDINFDFASNLKVDINYTVVGADITASNPAAAIANKLAAKINSNGTFLMGGLKTQATVVGSSIYITTVSNIFYSTAVTQFGSGPYHVTSNEKPFDFTAFDQMNVPPEQCDPIHGLYRGQKDQSGVFFCDGTNGQGTAFEAPYNNLYENRADLILPKAFSGGGYFVRQALSSSSLPPVWCGSTPCWSEFFAETIAEEVAPMNGSSQTPDNFLGSGHFPCATAAIRAILSTGQKPTAGQLAPNCN